MDEHKLAFNVIVLSFFVFVRTLQKRRIILAKRNASLDCCLSSRVKWISKHSSWDWMTKFHLINIRLRISLLQMWTKFFSFSHSSNKNIVFMIIKYYLHDRFRWQSLTTDKRKIQISRFCLGSLKHSNVIWLDYLSPVYGQFCAFKSDLCVSELNEQSRKIDPNRMNMDFRLFDHFSSKRKKDGKIQSNWRFSATLNYLSDSFVSIALNPLKQIKGYEQNDIDDKKIIFRIDWYIDEYDERECIKTISIFVYSNCAMISKRRGWWMVRMVWTLWTVNITKN